MSSFTVESFSSPIPLDVKPDLDVDEPDTDTADTDAPYGYTPTGRVRKRPVGARKNVTRQAGASNEKLARQAAKTLVQLHGIFAVPIMLIGLQQTASALTDEERNALFEEQAYSALLPDPSLCRSILRAGSDSGKFALTIAYLMFGAGVGMVAYPEFKELQAYRKASKGRDD